MYVFFIFIIYRNIENIVILYIIYICIILDLLVGEILFMIKKVKVLEVSEENFLENFVF